MVSLRVELTQTADGLSAQFVSGLNSVKQNNRNVNVLEVKCSNFSLTQNQTIHAAFSTSVNPDDVNAEDTGALLVAYQSASDSYKLKLPASVLARKGKWYCTLSVRTWCGGQTPCAVCPNGQTGACSDTCAYLETYVEQESSSAMEFSVCETFAQGGVESVPTEADVIAMYLTAQSVLASMKEMLALMKKGEAGGVATLDEEGRIPEAQLPTKIDAQSVGGYTPEKFILASQKGNAYGVATLDGSGKVPVMQLPAEIDAQSVGGYTPTQFVLNSRVGAAYGVAGLDAAGKVPAAQLPSYVDDVVEGYYNPTDSLFYEDASFLRGAIAGEGGKIYVDLASRKTYRWSGSAATGFIEIPVSLALGETASTAYAGDKGKANAQAIAELQAAVDGLSSGGGGAKRYLHELYFDSDENQSIRMACAVINNDPRPFHLDADADYLRTLPRELLYKNVMFTYEGSDLYGFIAGTAYEDSMGFNVVICCDPNMMDYDGGGWQFTFGGNYSDILEDTVTEI